jgi:uncharacterized protein (AIM24 family)
MAINLDNKQFKTLNNSDNGEVSDETVFHYRQEGDIIFAAYRGGNIVQGQLIGKIVLANHLEFVYQHINTDKELMTGKCKSYPELDKSGKIILKDSGNGLVKITAKDNQH